MIIICLPLCIDSFAAIPEDISVVSLDNSELASYTEPAQTTVNFRCAIQDEMAVKFLLELLGNPTLEMHRRVLTPNGLVLRESRRPLS